MAEPQPLGFDPMRVVATAPAMRTTLDDGTVLVGPLPEDLPDEMRRTLADGRVSYDFMSAFGALWGSASMLYSQMQPLQDTANRLPSIVAHSDEVHTELQQGLDAIRTAVASVQQAASSLSTSLPSIAQLAAQAQVQAGVANAAATAAGQRCAALEAQYASLAAKVAAHDARLAALEARKVSTYRAAGNLPTLAVNGTTAVTCAWTSVVPSPLPAVDQCQVFVAGSAAPTVTAVSATGVTVSLKAIAALLPSPGAVQVFATTWA